MTRPFATNLRHIENIVFAGAGVAGTAYVGAIEALEKEGLLGHVKRFAGTSSGSIAALACALGYRGPALKRVLDELEFSKFANFDGYERRVVFKSLARNGLFSGRELRRCAQKIVAQRLGNPDLSFATLHIFRDMALNGPTDEPGKFFIEQYNLAIERLPLIREELGDPHFEFEFKNPEELRANASTISDLVVIAAEVNTRSPTAHTRYKEQQFSLYATPDNSIAQAVRASAAYPFFFRYATLNVNGRERRYTDGGLVNLLPVTLFDVHGKPNPNTLALDVKASETKLVEPQSQIKKFVTSLISAGFGRARTKAVRQRFDMLSEQCAQNEAITSRTIMLPKGNVSATDFTLTKLSKEWLYKSGYDTMSAVISQQLAMPITAESPLLLQRLMKKISASGPPQAYSR